MAVRVFFIGITICFLLYKSAWAQSSKIDSLEQLYPTATEDSVRIRILKDISWEYLTNHYNAELAKKYIDSVYSISLNKDIGWGLALANYQYAVFERQKGNYNNAITYIDKYLEFWQASNNENALADGLYQKAIILDDIGSFDKSLDIYYSILKIYEERQDEYSIATILNALGEILKKTGKLDNAMSHYTRALKMFTNLNSKADIANCYFNIGDTHLMVKEYDSALVYFNKALDIDKEINSQWGVAYDYESIGKVSELKGDLNEALSYHQNALEIRETLGQKRELSSSFTALGNINRKLKNYRAAEEQLQRALQITEKIGAKAEMRDNYQALSLLYEQTGDLTQALAFKKKYITINDSLFNEAKSQQIEELQVRFDTEKQQAAITALEKDAEIADLKIKRQTTLRNVLIGVVIIAIVLSIALFNRYKYRQRVRMEADEKKRMLENEKRKTELEKKRVEELKKIDKLKDEFLANTSHELRTPLNGIIGLTESLKDGAAGNLPVKAVDNLDMISKSGRRLSHLINDILDFSKLKNKDLILSIAPADLYSVAQVILKLSEPLVANRKISLKNTIDKNVPLVDADENRLQQILHNLIGNAIKFTHKGKVSISATVKKPLLAVTVSDTGIGIKREKFDTIFDSFEQGDGSTIREYGGTGLGLSVTKQLVELHGGTISVDSEVDKGSSFTFTLPLSSTARSESELQSVDLEESVSGIQQDSSDDTEIETTTYESSPHKIKILVVDDEPVNRRVLENHLTFAGYQVKEAGSGQEAINYFKKDERFDLVLLDIMMPGMSGFEVCEFIRSKYLTSELPVLMLTAKNRVSDLVTGFNAGANDYLTKPFSKNELLSRIKTHLNLQGIHKAASKFVPTEFIRSIGRSEITEVELGDQVEKEVTVLFSDIRQYTQLAENMTPRQNFKFVNSFVGKMGPIIRENEGFVNQYLGDGIMALFPINSAHALRSAIGMQKAVHSYNKRRIKEGNQPISMGVGMHTGPLIMGIIGDLDRNDTAIIPDTVNTASRMEGVTKFYGANIILSEDSLKTVEDKEQFGLRYLGKVKVKGKDKSLGIYECFDGDREEKSIKLKRKTLKEFEKGIGYFMNGEFPKASASFDKVLTQNPDDLVSKYFITKSAEFTLSGFPKDWDVVTSMDAK